MGQFALTMVILVVSFKIQVFSQASTWPSCTSDSQCTNSFHECDMFNATYNLCMGKCMGQPCTVNGDCWSNVCTNGICDGTNGNIKGALCYSVTKSKCGCADGLMCNIAVDLSGNPGMCVDPTSTTITVTSTTTTQLPTTTTTAVQPLTTWPTCSSSSQCTNSFYECNSFNATYNLCLGKCMGQPCTINGDCWSNMCTNGICDGTNGNIKGALCYSVTKSKCGCADGLMCNIAVDLSGNPGMCVDPTSTTITTTQLPATTTISIQPQTIWPACSSNSQCTNSFHECNSFNATYNLCLGKCTGLPCTINGDCWSNVCTNGICDGTNGNIKGALCYSVTKSKCGCADGLVCNIAVDLSGNPGMCVEPEAPTTTTQTPATTAVPKCTKAKDCNPYPGTKCTSEECQLPVTTTKKAPKTTKPPKTLRPTTPLPTDGSCSKTKDCTTLYGSAYACKFGWCHKVGGRANCLKDASTGKVDYIASCAWSQCDKDHLCVASNECCVPKV